MLQRKFVASKPDFVQLKPGWHQVRLANAFESDSFTQYNGSAKEKSYGWIDPCPQLIATLVSNEKSVIGGVTTRFNLLAYKKYDKLNEKQIKSKKYHDIVGYACMKQKDGTFIRVIDEEGLKACDNILNSALYALGLPEGFVPVTCQDEDGTVYESQFPEVLESGEPLIADILVEEKVYEDKIQLRITKWRRPKLEPKTIVTADGELHEPAGTVMME